MTRLFLIAQFYLQFFGKECFTSRKLLKLQIMFSKHLRLELSRVVTPFFSFSLSNSLSHYIFSLSLCLSRSLLHDSKEANSFDTFLSGCSRKIERLHILQLFHNSRAITSESFSCQIGGPGVEKRTIGRRSEEPSSIKTVFAWIICGNSGSCLLTLVGAFRTLSAAAKVRRKQEKLDPLPDPFCLTELVTACCRTELGQ